MSQSETAADATIYADCSAIEQGTFTLLGTKTPGSANEMLHAISVTARAAIAPAANSEKIALYVISCNGDTSTIGDAGGVFNDLVGIESHAFIAAGNPQGRIWGYHTSFIVPSGADGFAVGLEVELTNNGISTGDPASPHQKIGLHVVGNGPNPGSFGLKFTTSAYGGGWNGGIFFDQNAVLPGGGVLVIPNDTNINAWDAAGTTQVGLMSLSHDNQVLIGTGSAEVVAGNQFVPALDGAFSCGASTQRWSNVWTVDGSTSALWKVVRELSAKVAALEARANEKR